MTGDANRLMRALPWLARVPSWIGQEWKSIAAIILIPLYVGRFQHLEAERGLHEQYVALAITILNAPANAKVAPGLRDWAVAIVNEYAPIPLPPRAAEALAKGAALAAELSDTVTATGTLTAGPKPQCPITQIRSCRSARPSSAPR